MTTDSEKAKALEILKLSGLPTEGIGYWWIISPVRAVEELVKMQENTNAEMRMNDKKLIWQERIVTNVGNHFHISIESSLIYPFTMPDVFVLDPVIDLDKTPHIYVDRTLCLMHENDYNSKMSILHIRNMASAWCWCYDIFKETGNWPAAERAHEFE